MRLHSRPDGIIALVRSNPEMRLLKDWKIPAVNVSGRFEQSVLPRVCSDNPAIGRMAAQHLLQAGYEEFLYVGEPDEYFAEERWLGFKQTLADCGRTCRRLRLDAFLDGSAVFMFVDDWRDRPVEVTVNAPPEWRIACGMEFKNGSKNVLVADNYDVLVDSPIEVGLHEKIVFEAAGRPHEVAIWGEAVYDEEELKEEFTKIIESQAAIFGGVPYKRYVFQVHASPGLSGGTEHLNSTIMQTSSTFGENRASLRGFLGLVAHEYFHTWNVKQFRPAGIHPYDYLRENYTTQLWVAEGSTSYYDDLTLARIGVAPRGEERQRRAHRLRRVRGGRVVGDRRHRASPGTGMTHRDPTAPIVRGGRS